RGDRPGERPRDLRVLEAQNLRVHQDAGFIRREPLKLTPGVVASGRDSLRIGFARPQLRDVEIDPGLPELPSPLVDENPTCDVEEPGLEGPARVVRVPEPVEPEEELLIEIAGASLAVDPAEEEAEGPGFIAAEQLFEGALAPV